MEHNGDDIQLRNILSKTAKEMPFPDFEDVVIFEIRKEKASRTTYLTAIRLSWVFYIIGILSGIMLIASSSFLKEIFSNPNDNTDVVLLIIVSCLLMLLFSEKLIKHSFIKGR